MQNSNDWSSSLRPAFKIINENMEILVVDPLDNNCWDELLQTNPKSSFFHTSAWAKVLNETYQYKPVYFTCIKNNTLSGLIAIAEVKSFLTGFRGVSLPFSDFCEIVAENECDYQRLKKCVFDYGKKSKWRFVEYRGGMRFLSSETPYSSQYMHSLDLSRNEKEIFRSLSRSTRRNIKIAIRDGVEIEINHNLSAVNSFYKLHCRTRKYHGVPPQPYTFFKNLYEYVITKNNGAVFVARYSGRDVAAAIVLYFGSKAVYKFSAFDRQYWRAKPNNLLLWTVIKWACENGFKNLHLGRTETQNRGLLAFKEKWGPVEKVQHYYRFDLKKECFVQSTFGNIPLDVCKKISKIMPSSLFNLTGSILYRHMG